MENRQYIKTLDPSQQRSNVIAFRASTADRALAEDISKAMNARYMSEMFRELMNEKAKELGVI